MAKDPWHQPEIIIKDGDVLIGIGSIEARSAESAKQARSANWRQKESGSAEQEEKKTLSPGQDHFIQFCLPKKSPFPIWTPLCLSRLYVVVRWK